MEFKKLQMMHIINFLCIKLKTSSLSRIQNIQSLPQNPLENPDLPQNLGEKWHLRQNDLVVLVSL